MRDTIVDRLLGNEGRIGDRTAFHVKRKGAWERITWRAYADQCRAFAGALVAEGCHPRDGVAIQGGNCPEWVFACVGAMMARCLPAGIYQTCAPEQAAFITDHSDAKVLVLENKQYWDRIAPKLAELPKVRRVVMIRDAETIGDARVLSFAAFCEQGKKQSHAVAERIAAIEEKDVATLIYTSGTTGPPKGVMLTHGNLSFAGIVGKEFTDATPDDTTVSYLPLAHIAEQMITVHLAITIGYSLWFAESVEQLREVMAAARPNFFLGVPRVWEKLKSAIEAKIVEQKGLKRKLLDWARATTLEAGLHRLQHGQPKRLLALKARIADRLVISKMKALLGFDRTRSGLTGAAPIGKDVLEFFLSLGIPIHEVYGQSEGTALATSNRQLPGQTRLGTVGRPTKGTEVKIAEDGEILVRGPGLFAGYHKDEAATREVLVDGWLHSGDVGVFDADGFLRITDRKKELLITSGGKNVSPQNLERLLRAIPGVSQAVAIGDQRHFLTALLTVDPLTVKSVAPGWPGDRKGFEAHVQKQIDRINGQVSRVENIRKFVLLGADFTVEGGEITPTQKLRRKVILEKYKGEIDRMYTEAP